MDDIPVRQPVEDSKQSNTMDEVFSKFAKVFKEFEEGSQYNDFKDIEIYFDSQMLEMDDTTDIEAILDEINRISRRIFMYGVVFESQQRVVQELEDEFERWKAEMYVTVDSATESVMDKKGNVTEKKITRTETAKEKYIMTAYADEYEPYRIKLRDEKFKLGLVKRVCAGLDSYSYKLHAILTYRQIALQKGL